MATRSFARICLICFILLSTTIEKSVEIRLYSPRLCYFCQDTIQKLES